MKQILSVLILSAGIILNASASKSQEQHGCFMLDANGQPMDLSHLCDSSSQKISIPGLFQAPIKRRESGVPIIDVTFNGKQTFEMMVDTGASGTVLTQEVAKALKVQPEGTILVHTPSDSNVVFPTGRVASVAAGGAVAKNLDVAISPSLSIGLLGQNFFGDYDVTIKANVVEFRIR